MPILDNLQTLTENYYEHEIQWKYPYLGVYPSTHNNNLIHLKINTDKDTEKIVWWAADNETDKKIINNPNDAYKNYNNSGLSLVENGKTEVVLLCPKSYTVNGRKLPKHLHYRESKKNILGDVKTIDIKCDNN